MFPCVQLLPPGWAVDGQVELEQTPAAHLLMPAACRSQSLEYVRPSQPQTGSKTDSQPVGLIAQVPAGSTAAQSPARSPKTCGGPAPAAGGAPPPPPLPPPPPRAPAPPGPPVVPAVRSAPPAPARPLLPPLPAAPVP